MVASKTVRVVVYGMSTEGYTIAARMAIHGAEVYLIDEATPSAILLNAEIARTYPDVESLREDEPLLSMEPINVAISKARYLFFAPRIRRSTDEVKNEIRAKFRDAVVPMQEGSSVVFTLPMGLGDNNINISLLEHMTGFEAGKTVSYFYYPLESHAPDPGIIGSFNGQADPMLLELLAAGTGGRDGGGPADTTIDTTPDPPAAFSAISSAEHMHAIRTLSKFASMCGSLELCRHIPDEQTAEDMYSSHLQDMFLDEMASGLFDLKSLGSSFSGSNTITHMINLTMKSIDNYLKRLVDVIRKTLRDNGLKGSRIKIALFWTMDKHIMRGDQAEMLERLTARLHDYITDVEIYGDSEFDLLLSDKVTIVVACTKRNFESIELTKGDFDLIVIKANPLCEAVR